MILEKRITLQPLLASKNGIHLTAYLVNRGKLDDLQFQIHEIIETAKEYIEPVMNPEEVQRFLDPIHGLYNDTRLLKNLSANIGIFRTADAFRILNIPVDVDPLCIVATTFHVKPLLKWMQVDRDFLILGVEKDAAHLYHGSQNTLKRLDTMIYPEIRAKTTLENSAGVLNRKQKTQARENFVYLNDWMKEQIGPSNPKLFILGEKHLLDVLSKTLKYQNTAIPLVIEGFNRSRVPEICLEIRNLLKFEARRTLDQALSEFRYAEDLNLAKKNIFHIAKAAIQGRVKKLIIADGINIFGKLNFKNGNLEIHPGDLDHQDDDILDDLAQSVLSQGGEVIIAPRDEIPKGHPALAILDHQSLIAQPFGKYMPDQNERRII